MIWHSIPKLLWIISCTRAMSERLSIADADGVGEVGNAKCGDIMKMQLQIEDGIIDRRSVLRHSAAAARSHRAPSRPR